MKINKESKLVLAAFIAAYALLLAGFQGGKQLVMADNSAQSLIQEM